MKSLVGLLIATLAGLGALPTGWTYPLDGYDYTGIRRLDFYQRAQTGEVRGRRLPAGALLPMTQVQPRLVDRPPSPLPAIDAQKSRQLARLLGPEADHYGIALLDLSAPDTPHYAAHRGDWLANAGSVGKLLVALALFQRLADLYPDDLPARLRILRETPVVADHFILTDHHRVPLWSPDQRQLRYRPLQLGDQGSLWEFLDWMLSASSNAAASMVMRELLLLQQFGHDYPPSPAQAQAFFAQHNAQTLGEFMAAALLPVIERQGLDPTQLRQGSFFTREGKRRVNGSRSFATPSQLVHLLYRLEQGRLVDSFSSRELKRLLYMTQRRIRYASHPAMHGDAIYFKSGSLYRCQPEPDFQCRKYHGNVENRLASVAIVESPAGQPRYHYLVAVMSNVLRKNSAVAHQTLALRIQQLVESWHPPPAPHTNSSGGSP